MLQSKARRFPIMFVGLFILFQVGLYFYAWAIEGTNSFHGVLINVFDGHSYLAKMEQGYQGYWKLRLLHSANPGEGGYIFVFYLFLGHLARWVGTSTIYVFHIVRIAAGLWMLFALLRFFESFMPDKQQIIWGTSVALFGGGLGWLGLLFDRMPVDFWVAEAYPFLGTLTNPHFPLTLAIMVTMLTPSDRTGQVFLKWYWAAFLSFLLAIISPFGVVIVILIWSLLILWDLFDFVRWKYIQTDRLVFSVMQCIWKHPLLWPLLAGFAAGLPVLIYYLILVSTDPVFAVWNSQNVTPAPSLWDIVLGFSPALIVSVLAFRSGNLEDHKNIKPLVIWVLLGLGLTIVPFNLQRRFLLGLYVPLITLGFVGLGNYIQSQGRQRLCALVLLILSIPTNVIIYTSNLIAVDAQSPALYASSSEVEAMEWLRLQGQDRLVLASPETSLFLPGRTGDRVVAGHPYESVYYEQSRQLVEKFYSDEIRWDELNEYVLVELGSTIDYVFVGPRERSFGNPNLAKLRLVYTNGDIEIYAGEGQRP